MKTAKRKFAEAKFFTHNTLKNCHIEFIGEGCYIWVSINVGNKASKYLSPNNLYKGNKRLVYALKKHVKQANMNAIQEAYETLLNTCMINSRIAKQKVLEDEIKMLNN